MLLLCKCLVTTCRFVRCIKVQEDSEAYQCDSEAENPSFAVHKQNAVFVPRVQVEVVVHAKSTHVLQGVVSVLQLHFLHSCRR